MSDHEDDEDALDNVIPFRRAAGTSENVGPFCVKCRKRHYERNEGRGKCGHPVYFAGLAYCGRCAILGRICRACGADVSEVFRQMRQESRKRRRQEKERIKVFKK